jgi:DNA-binding MarR family transcriptional regulator
VDNKPASKRRKIIANLMQAGREEMRLSLLWSNTAAELMGIHSTDAIAVTFLIEVGEATAGQLAKVTGLTTGAMTAAIDRLERAGLAIRKVDPHDRRKVIVKVVKIPAQLSELRTSMRNELGDTLSRYTDGELLRFIEFRNVTNALLKRSIGLQDDRRVRAYIHKRNNK